MKLIDEKLAEKLIDRLAAKVADNLRAQPLMIIDVTPAMDDVDVKADEPEDDGLTEAQRLQVERREAAMRRA